MSLHTLFETQVKIGISDADFKKGIAAAGTAVKDFAVQGGRALFDFARDSVETGRQFDTSMAQVAATMGQTVDEIAELRDFAKEMGSTTAFSASQAADALNYMALAGYDAKMSMEMLPNVLNLAAAGGIELANASDMVTDAQSALGLSAEETTALVDKMATASSKSNTSVAQLGQAILTVGGTAKNLKGGTTELATTLGILADNGIKGAEGGTALRNILNSLIAPTENAQAVLDELGVKVFDDTGNIKSLNDVFLDMRNGMDKLTQQERMKAMSELFNTRDMKSAEAIISNVGDRYNELAGYIDNAAGAAAKMAETQLDTLEGDKTKFSSALEGIKLAISDAITPTLRDATQFGTKWIGRISKAIEKGNPVAIGRSIAHMIKNGAKEIKEFASEIIPEITPIITEIGGEMGKMLLGLLPDWLGDDIKSIFGSVSSFVKSIDFGKLKSSLSGLGESLEPLVQKLSGGIAWAFENVLKPLGTWLVNDAIPLGIDLISAALDNINNVLNILAPIAQPIWDNFLSPLFSAVGDLAVGSLDILANSLKTIGEAFKDFDSAGFLEDVMNGNFFEDWKIGMGVIGDTLETFGADIDDFFKGPGEKWNQLWQNFGGVVFELKEDLVAAFEAIKRGIEGIGEAIDKHNSFWSSLGEKAYDKIHGIDSNADGGYVSTPRLSWVAEKEPEYIIPESKMDKVFNRNSGDVIININVEGGISSDYDVERLASKLAELNVLQTRAIGGTSF